MFKMLRFFVLTLCVTFTLSESLDGVYEKCGTNVRCAEDKVINIIDEYDNRASIKILGGFVTIEKNDEKIEVPKSEDVIGRFVRYITSHEIKINLPNIQGRSLLSETRSSKLKKIILPALLLLKLKAAVLIPAALSAIALVAFKGMGAGLVALLLAAATAFKSALEGHSGSKRVSFEVVPPHWSRAGIAPSAPAAAAYVQEWPLHPYQTIP